MNVIIGVSLEISNGWNEHIKEMALEMSERIPVGQRAVLMEEFFEAVREQVSRAFGETTGKAGVE